MPPALLHILAHCTFETTDDEVVQQKRRRRRNAFRRWWQSAWIPPPGCCIIVDVGVMRTEDSSLIHNKRIRRQNSCLVGGLGNTIWLENGIPSRWDHHVWIMCWTALNAFVHAVGRRQCLCVACAAPPPCLRYTSSRNVHMVSVENKIATSRMRSGGLLCSCNEARCIQKSRTK